ncbi:MAG TPA: hypothetical protein VFD30_02240 [Terriglobia bacterium]|jgi:hypothetical protein|nr:hypothetical protein [Terriglobia bacterium]
MSKKFIIVCLDGQGHWTVAATTPFNSSLEARMYADRLPAEQMPQVVAVPESNLVSPHNLVPSSLEGGATELNQPVN